MPPTTGDLIEHLRRFIGSPSVTVFLEDMVKFAGKNAPASSIAVYARNYGIVEGAVQALGLRLEFVRAQKWQKELACGTRNGRSDTEWKNHLKGMAQRLYPDIDVTLATADALLILEYAKRVSRT